MHHQKGPPDQSLKGPLHLLGCQALGFWKGAGDDFDCNKRINKTKVNLIEIEKVRVYASLC